MAELPAQVLATDLAIHLIRVLREKHGPLMFHQSGGCCDGSSPMCYTRGELIIGDNDVLLGHLTLDQDWVEEMSGRLLLGIDSELDPARGLV